MDLAHVWTQYLANWPVGIERRGVVVTSQEQIVFVSFLMSDTVVMFDRRAPDSVGGRKVVLPYSEIKAIKVIDPVGNQPFVDVGFKESWKPRKPAAVTPAAVAAKNASRPVPQKT